MKKKDTCPICNGSGWRLYWKFVPELNGEYEFGEKCTCDTQKTRSKPERVEESGIPFQNKDARMSAFQMDIYRSGISVSDAVNAVKDIKLWLENMEVNMAEGIGLYLHSSSKGSGKTLMASIIGNELIDKGYRVKFTTTTELLMRIRSSWDNKYIKESEILKEMTNPQVLIIDDIGVEGDKQWIGERFYHIINKRYENNKPTVYTSNCRIDELTIDARISSRILEKSLAINFPEESVRVIRSQVRKMDYLELIKERSAEK